MYAVDLGWLGEELKLFGTNVNDLNKTEFAKITVEKIVAILNYREDAFDGVNVINFEANMWNEIGLLEQGTYGGNGDDLIIPIVNDIKKIMLKYGIDARTMFKYKIVLNKAYFIMDLDKTIEFYKDKIYPEDRVCEVAEYVSENPTVEDFQRYDATYRK